MNLRLTAVNDKEKFHKQEKQLKCHCNQLRTSY